MFLSVNVYVSDRREHPPLPDRAAESVPPPSSCRRNLGKSSSAAIKIYRANLPAYFFNRCVSRDFTNCCCCFCVKSHDGRDKIKTGIFQVLRLC